MDQTWGDYQWVIIMAGALGVGLASFIGYFRRPRNGGDRSVMHGAAIGDSSVGREIVIELRRIANAADKIVIEMAHTAENERMRDAVAAALQAERRKRERGD